MLSPPFGVKKEQRQNVFAPDNNGTKKQFYENQF